jgi:hypothetical protein
LKYPPTTKFGREMTRHLGVEEVLQPEPVPNTSEQQEVPVSRYEVVQKCVVTMRACATVPCSDEESVTSAETRMSENAGKTPGSLERAVRKIMAEPS